MTTTEPDKEESDKEEPDRDTVIFVPAAWNQSSSGGRVTTPKELEKKRAGDAYPVDEMLGLATEIESADHLRELCEEHFDSDAYSLFALLDEYCTRASEEKLLEGFRSEVLLAFVLARGEVPSSINEKSKSWLERTWKNLRADLDEAAVHLDRAKRFWTALD